MNEHFDLDSERAGDTPLGSTGANIAGSDRVDALLKAHARTFTPTPALQRRVRELAGGQPRFVLPRWARFGLVAASIGVAAFVGAYAIQGPRVLTIVGIEEPLSSLRPRLVSFLWKEHERCGMNEEIAAEKFAVRSFDKVAPQFATYLSATPDLDGLDRCGLRFLGAGECSVPGRENSIHLRFDSHGSSKLGDIEVSVFVQGAGGVLALETGRIYSLLKPTDTAIACATDEVLAWKKDGLVYFVVCRSIEGRQLVARVLKAPQEIGRI